MPTCPSCGGEAPEGTGFFCEHCGQQLDVIAPGVYPVKDPSTGPFFQVNTGNYFETGWHTFWQYPLGFTSYIFIMAIVSVTFTNLLRIPLVGTAYYTFLQAGVFIVSAKLLQDQIPRFSDFFSCFHYFRPLLIFSLISSFFLWLPEFLKIFSYPHYVILSSILFNLIKHPF